MHRNIRRTPDYARRGRTLDTLQNSIATFLKKIADDLDPEEFTEEEFIDSYAVFTKKERTPEDFDEKQLVELLKEMLGRDLICETSPNTFALTDAGRMIADD
jgi:hypothetical protein